MKTHEKLRAIRVLNDWSQDEMAEKLGYSVNGYAKIEQGKTQIKADKLAQIAEILGMDFQQLLDLNEKNVFNTIEHFSSQYGNIYLTETQCAHELEKSQLLLKERDKEINGLNEQIAQLKEIITLMKKQLT